MHGLDCLSSAVFTLLYLIVGVTKAFCYKQAMKSFPWVKDVPRALVQFIGIAESLGAVGLTPPAATGFYGWLTPVAAGALIAQAGPELGRGRCHDAVGLYHRARPGSDRFAVYVDLATDWWYDWPRPYQ